MVSKDFRINVLARIALLTILIVVFAWSLVNTTWQATPFVCAVLALILGFELIRYVESVNRELTSFLNFVSHHDFSLAFPIAEKGPVFHDLEHAYKVLAGQYRELNQQKAVNHQYLESVIEHVNTALVCLDDEDKVELMNRQAQRLLRSPHLHSIRSFRKIDARLPAILEALDDGDHQLVDINLDGEPLQLALFTTKFQLLGRYYKLISFQNIRDELEQREIDFSQKLIRVMTHEIMNSVTPIIALSKVVEDTLLETGVDGRSLESLGGSERGDLVRSVASIQSRGSGLLRFVQAYSSLTNLPKPRFADVSAAQLLEEVSILMAPTLEAKRIVIESHIEPPDLSIRADAQQLQQVLINLVNNAVDALAGRENAKVVLSAAQDSNGAPSIQVSDNGPGIEQGYLDDIFVPFFTTKQHGTGVGLSVSRQIMFQNKGVITVNSIPNHGAQFTLKFK